MLKKLVKWSSSLFGKGGEIETQKFEPLRRSTDKLDLPESEITEAYATGKLPKRTAHTFVGKGHLHVGGKQMPPAPMPTQLPPKAPPPSKTVFYDPAIVSSVQEEGQRIIRTMPTELFSSNTDGIQAKGGEFSGAGASGSWDSPSSCSSDTSSSSSDSGSSSCGSD